MSRKRKKQRSNRKKATRIGKAATLKRQRRLWRKLSFSNAIAVISLLVTVLALVTYLFFEWPRPRIVITDIKHVTDNPLKHQFNVSNTGNVIASRLRVLVTIDVNDPSNRIVIDNVGFGGFSPIEDIDVAPNQSISFDLERAMPLNKLLSVDNTEVFPSDATAKISFKYKGLLSYTYEEEVSLRTFPENSNLIWKPVGPNHSQVFR